MKAKKKEMDRTLKKQMREIDRAIRSNSYNHNFTLKNWNHKGKRQKKP